MFSALIHILGLFQKKSLFKVFRMTIIGFVGYQAITHLCDRKSHALLRMRASPFHPKHYPTIPQNKGTRVICFYLIAEEEELCVGKNMRKGVLAGTYISNI